MRRRFAFLNLRRKSLVRGIVLSLGAFLVSLHLAGFPSIENLHGSRWQALCMAGALGGMIDVARCLQRRWTWYHGGVLLLLYTNLMILAMIGFLVVYP